MWDEMELAEGAYSTGAIGHSPAQGEWVSKEVGTRARTLYAHRVRGVTSALLVGPVVDG